MRFLLRKIIPSSFIIILFGCGPIGLINVLDIIESLKNEVDYPRAMGSESIDLNKLEMYYKRLLVVFWSIMILGPISAITIIIRKHLKSKIST